MEDGQLEERCEKQGNQIVSGQADLPPALVNSFVLVNGRINIVPDVTVFIRGDSNGDTTVDLSDAVTLLGYLFLGSGRPSCYDAGDANDDGELNISDAITIVASLFLVEHPSRPPPTVQVRTHTRWNDLRDRGDVTR